jgi:hypothetical protein
MMHQQETDQTLGVAMILGGQPYYVATAGTGARFSQTAQKIAISSTQEGAQSALDLGSVVYGKPSVLMGVVGDLVTQEKTVVSVEFFGGISGELARRIVGAYVDATGFSTSDEVRARIPGLSENVVPVV